MQGKGRKVDYSRWDKLVDDAEKEDAAAAGVPGPGAFRESAVKDDSVRGTEFSMTVLSTYCPVSCRGC
jgi:hypothetical protein